MTQNRRTGRSKTVARKPQDEWAVLAVTPARLKKRVIEREISLRQLADLCGHASHSHLWRLMKGDVKTTSIHTADVLETVLDARGLLFARMSARTSNRAAA